MRDLTALFVLSLGVVAWLASFVLVALGRSGSPPSSAASTSFREALEAVCAELRSLPLLRDLSAQSARRKRRTCLLRELPQLLDVVMLGLLSGLSFDASLELYCGRFETQTAALFREALTSWRMGMCSRERALVDMAEEFDVDALRRFSSAVSQALHFGAPLALVLERQADVIRQEQRSDVEEEIEKTPVRMMVPLGTMVVPAMLLAILGPLLGASVRLG